MSLFTHQSTLQKSVSCTGVGLHSGKEVSLSLQPAPENYGIRFIREDLQSTPLKVSPDIVVDTTLCTVIGKDNITIRTVEHLMAALAGMGIDNALITLDGPEIPIMDGSSGPFISLIEEAGIAHQDAPKLYMHIRETVEIRNKDAYIRIMPSPHFSLTFTLDYSKKSTLSKQSYTLSSRKDNFKQDLAHARTFCFYEDVQWLKNNGFAQGGSLDNAIVLDGEKVLNPEGLRYNNEMARHKALDIIGDLALLGYPLIGHIDALSSGHTLNHALTKALMAAPHTWELKALPTTARYIEDTPLLAHSPL